MVVESMVVVVPLTVRFPPIVTFPLLSAKTTVPDVLGKVIVRSAVGSVAVKVVSKLFSVEPSKIILALGISKFLLLSSSATPLVDPFSASSM